MSGSDFGVQCELLVLIGNIYKLFNDELSAVK